VVPVTARLSRKFYDAFGDDLANELVEWFNQVDLTYRTDLRELNELNFARFDAKLEQRVAELRGDMGLVEARLERRVAQLETRVEHGFAQQATRMDGKLDAMRVELIRWMFLLWVGSVGLALVVSRLAGVLHQLRFLLSFAACPHPLAWSLFRGSGIGTSGENSKEYSPVLTQPSAHQPARPAAFDKGQR
jgi:hypothetical protein